MLFWGLEPKIAFFWTELSCWGKSKATLLLGWSHLYKNYRPLRMGCSSRNIHFLNGNESFAFYVDYFLFLSPTRVLPDLIIWVNCVYRIRNRNCLTFAMTWVHLRLFDGVNFAARVVFLEGFFSNGFLGVLFVFVLCLVSNVACGSWVNLLCIVHFDLYLICFHVVCSVLGCPRRLPPVRFVFSLPSVFRGIMSYWWYLYLFTHHGVQRKLTLWITRRVFYKKQERLMLRGHMGPTPDLFVGFVLLMPFVFGFL